MKRRGMLIAAVILFSLGVMLFAKGYQRNYIASNAENADVNIEVTGTNQNQAKQNDNQIKQEQNRIKEQNKEVDRNKNNDDASNPSKSEPQKQEKAKDNIIFLDTISGKKILSASTNIENRTVAEVTIEMLKSKGIRYRAVGAGETIYFSMIANLKERDAGPESGWCYFVNGKKYSVGAGVYRLKRDDVLEWKFLKDGVKP
ncbi:DUF4430 domain-containing protein [Fonticella tunisiensis]|uniref:Uncharacterized protein DUF4430 n=1 Tax=Fonticella tunisiensis TaxID=1096341 RepID=A0A4R7KB64_9CLOT|nr:DUF4430 domain-containing protein [Fonticella tunisiensis]TDT50726.1 uncharacterized protein DUF4430 [Fonticella tunisiensis]